MIIVCIILLFMESRTERIGIIGMGLAGTMVASLLVKLGFTVTIFDKRNEERNDSSDGSKSAFGNSQSASKRSINLALSYRGIESLREIVCLDIVMKSAISMGRRVIHERDGTVLTQPYGESHQALYSISREFINSVLIEHLKSETCEGKVRLLYDHSLVDVTIDGKCTFRQMDGAVRTFEFDLLIGADGAYSVTRENLLRHGRINFNRQYIKHGYKELSIPPILSSGGKPDYAIKNFDGLHIWPRGNFMLIALPNADKSFTATLFAPYRDPQGGFDSVDVNDESAILEYFNRHFPDTVPLMPNLYNDYKMNPVGSLVTVRVDPWAFGKVVLLGDAAHAVVPFYGQGMNAAFEDGLVLYEILRDRLTNLKCGIGHEETLLSEAAREFAAKRQPAANALADLCIEHYHDMASNTASRLYRFKKNVEAFLHWLLPTHFIPLYTLVTFTRTPYHMAVLTDAKQTTWIYAIVLSSFVATIAFFFFVFN